MRPTTFLGKKPTAVTIPHPTLGANKKPRLRPSFKIHMLGFPQQYHAGAAGHTGQVTSLPQYSGAAAGQGIVAPAAVPQNVPQTWAQGMQQNSGIQGNGSAGYSAPGGTQKEQMLQLKVNELMTQLRERDAKIRELTRELEQTRKSDVRGQVPGSKVYSTRTLPIPNRPYRPGVPAEPMNRYEATTIDPIDLRLQEFYNGTASAIQFKRINTGYYLFGTTSVELDIVNRKLLARTEDGWNRGKFGSIERFINRYESIEREKLGLSDADLSDQLA